LASALATTGIAALTAEAEGGVRSIACITFTILRFFWSLTFSFKAEG
jgi:hypothetical protein